MAFLSIAIDGPAGAGKSTLARQLAEALGFLYVDTGAIYRTVGLFAQKQGKDCGDQEQVAEILPTILISLSYEADGVQHMYLQGADVTEEIRQNHVSGYASQVAAMPRVREFLVEMQRGLSREHHVVMDGRDIGTVILPQADVKIFLTASAEKRAQRRFAELTAKGMAVPFSQVLSEIEARDAADYQREIAPLRRAEDALLLDTSDLSLEESFQALLSLVKENISL